MNGGVQKVEQLYKQTHEANMELQTLWVEHVLFTWQWWVGVSLTIFPWIIWVLLRKKESTMRFLSAGFFIMFISYWLDSLGVQLGFWYYQYAVIPFIPASIPWNTSLLPVFVMFLLQMKNIPNPYIKAFIFATISAFVAEPLAVWIKLYDPIKWKYLYSFPIYIVLFLISHYIYSRNSFQES